MNKRITAGLIAVVLVLGMLVSAVPAFAVDPTAFKVRPDMNIAEQTETINYTVSLGAVENMHALIFQLYIPAGLTYVEGSCVFSAGLSSTLNAETLEFSNDLKTFNVKTFSSSPYTSAGETDLFTFQCTVDVGTTGYLDVELFIDSTEFYDISFTSIPYDTLNLESTVCVPTPPGPPPGPSSPVTGVTINPHDLTIHIGDTDFVTAYVEPWDALNRDVKFSSDDESIVLVDEYTGYVTAVAEGTAIITATTDDGGMTDDCYVTVTPHDLEETVAKESTCLVKGNNQYFKCTICDKYFKADRTTETTVAEETLPYADHLYGSLISEVPATHFATGVEAHYQCSVCNKYFDADKAETTWDALVIPVIPHSYGGWEIDADNHWHECSCGNKIDEAAHVFDWIIDVEPTEEAVGHKHEECNVCHYRRNENTEIPKLEHTHVWTETPAKPSSCIERGNNQYFYCTSCGKYFKADKATQTTVAEETLPFADHLYGDLIPEVLATHTATGVEAHHQCSVCNKYFDADKAETTWVALIIPIIPHSYGEWEIDADNHWHECSCGNIIDEAAHIFDWIIDVEPTEEAVGLKHEECNVCHYRRNENTEIPKLDHTHAWTETVAKASTCIEHGNNQYFYCSGCGKYFKADKATETTVADETLPLADHIFGDWTVTKPATTTEVGSKERVCIVCGYKETAEIPMLEDTEPNEPESPHTSDTGMIALWIALASIVGVVGTVGYFLKKKRAE